MKTVEWTAAAWAGGLPVPRTVLGVGDVDGFLALVLTGSREDRWWKIVGGGPHNSC